jgi:hypothetical protein
LLIAALYGRIDAALELIARQADSRIVDNQNRTALTHFGSNNDDLSASQRRSRRDRPV